jgi:GNAT superfamily N-acetyltransferase
MPLTPTLRLARLDDASALEALIPLSVNTLQADTYSPAQRTAALGPVFGVDRQLIQDGTYYLCETPSGEIVACGGWSLRQAHFGGDVGRSTAAGEAPALDPMRHAARIRAFFVHPGWTRQGLGRRLLHACETAAAAAGFTGAELVATLAGEPLYAAGGYVAVERYEIPLPNGLVLPVVKMKRSLAHSLLVRDSKVL